MTAKAAAFPVIDALHLALMLAALVLAYILPFELLLLSYAILGPLHYLTEISWLHERSYFMGRRWLALVLVACTASLLYLPINTAGTAGMTLVFALTFSAAFALCKSTTARLVTLAGGIAAGLAISRVAAINLPLIILLPTVIHVSVFTFLFMVVGVLRSKSLSQMALIAVYIASLAAILTWPPSAGTHLPALAAFGPRYFGSIGAAFGQIFGPSVWPFDARLAGFLSFVYTYHYLNWFIKVRVIKWSDVPKGRLALVAVLGVGATALYFVNYTLGFVVLLSLSLLHVLLEFPLNTISIKEIARMAVPRRAQAS